MRRIIVVAILVLVAVGAIVAVAVRRHRTVTVYAVDAQGKPAADVRIGDFFGSQLKGHTPDSPRIEALNELGKTDSDGRCVLTHDPNLTRLLAIDASGAQMGIGKLTADTRQLSITLAKSGKISGTLACQPLAALGRPMDWTNVYLEHDGEWIAEYWSRRGNFEFRAPPGEYSLYAYGNIFPDKKVKVQLPPGTAKLIVPPIELSLSPLEMIKGKPAPEPAGVLAWKGSPTSLASLKGKVVLLEFWGYWCGACIGQTPNLMTLHDRYASKGLAIIGIHVDDEVLTPEALDRKLAPMRKADWKGRDLPFPTALTDGKTVTSPEGDEYRGAAAMQFGATRYPTTVLIDRAGNVVGQFWTQDMDYATKELEKALAAPVP